jgi:hypothetical protein
MKQLPALLSGAIAREYADLSLTKRAQAPNQTDTCGSDCSDGRECQDTTCANQQEEPQQSTVRARKQAFCPVVPGWNEPPAARL